MNNLEDSREIIYLHPPIPVYKEKLHFIEPTNKVSHIIIAIDNTNHIYLKQFQPNLKQKLTVKKIPTSYLSEPLKATLPSLNKI